MPSALVQRLAALPHPVLITEGVEEVASNVQEALQFLGREADGQAQQHLKQWRELFAEREQRLYYVNDEVGYNSWDAPPHFKFAEWSLDSRLYGVSLRLARDVYETLDAFLTRHPPEVVYAALATLAKVACNVADCGNSVEKYRAVKVENPKFRAAVWDVPGAAQILFVAGFKRQGEALHLAADAPLGPLRAAAARLRRLADKKGHSGSAAHVQADGHGDGGRPASRFYGQPGFRYQEQIWHCSACDHPVNDGSERLWTGRHDAPHGEFRYLCTTCDAAGDKFNLCQDCWDRFQQQQQQQQQHGQQQQQQHEQPSSGGGGSSAGSAGGGGPALHDPLHSFQHVGPRMTRHNDYYNQGQQEQGTDPRNPWGRPSVSGGSLSRALQRLGERHGIREQLSGYGPGGRLLPPSGKVPVAWSLAPCGPLFLNDTILMSVAPGGNAYHMQLAFSAAWDPQHGPEQQEELQQEQQQVQNHHQNTERLPDSLQLAGWACNDHRCCAERRLIASCVVEARRRGVAPHKVVTYVRRRLGGGLCIFRFRSDGSPGCSAPCTLCAREILKFDLKVCCLLSNGEVFCGKLTDPGAPSSKITGGQRSWLRWWACCQGRRPDGTHGDSVGGSDADDRGGTAAAAASSAKHAQTHAPLASGTPQNKPIEPHMSLFEQGTALARQVKSSDGKLRTKELLDVCRSVLPIVEKMGTGFGLVKHDVGGNIDRVAARAAAKPAEYEADVFAMVRDDVAAGTHTISTSVTKGLLWLKRAMEFVVALLEKLYTDRQLTLSQAASETYYATLQHYHGWIVTGTFTLALKIVPSREDFFAKVGAAPNDEAAMAAMHAFCTEFGAVLAEVQAFLAANDLDDPAKV
ncbi:pleckstrin homology domain-containing family A member 8-like [Micractinium conductrix]|uniref:Pleckstrin homology domain-containing family A member 8-like n=1 Tax=Micractinium conductrix TaxID=554055 RepID=A0A2P6VGJ0_9CHLO|nr:pleckstrin homology domain-containing family A member 8-like [Micractinium conductrix]|eukprot:PSC73205.1 pleckstrin homology domain-containing family A member 8-like [Micractinium conductrix]